jgi:PleD family two-component response regulator
LQGVEKRDEMTVGDEKTRILILGEASEMFESESILHPFHTISCEDISEMERIIGSGRFDLVLVDIEKLHRDGSDLYEHLKGLRQSAKVILFAKMHQETEARRLTFQDRTKTNGNEGGGIIADGYLITPVSRQKFMGMVFPGENIVQSDIRSDISHQKEYKLTIDKANKALVTQVGQERLLKLEELATTDELTGLKNRRYFMEFVRQVISRAKTNGGQVTLLVFDIDNFKHYNDVYTHLAGDEILKQTAILIQRCCRDHDVVGRIGGDEFAVVFWDPPKHGDKNDDERRSPGSEHPLEPVFIADRLLNEIGNAEFAMLGREGRGVLTISGGMATFPRDGWNLQQLYTQADKALIHAKRGGKNRIYLVGEPKRRQ